MNDLTYFNEKRTARTQARVNELIDLVREKPKITEREILAVLTKRWDVSNSTVSQIMQYCRRKGIIVLERIWSVKSGVKLNTK